MFDLDTIKRNLRTSALAAVGTAVLAGTSFAQVSVDEALPEYTAAQGVSGTISSVGSDTMNNMMAIWAEAFVDMYPNVQVEIEGAGSSTAPPALIAGTSNFGPMSRAMKGEEVEAFQEAFGYAPTGLATSIDMLAVYVHKDNPIAQTGLSLQQIDAIFSSTRLGGYPTAIDSWGQAGLAGPFANAPIELYGRNSASGTYGYFKKVALFRGDYRDTVKEQPGSSAVVQGVASDLFGIGYSGLGYRTADVAVVPLAVEDGGDFIPAEAEFAYDGSYPLARPLYLYVNIEPGVELDPLRREFLRFIFSKNGQEVVVEDGYLPVSADVARAQLESAGIEPGF